MHLERGDRDLERKSRSRIIKLAEVAALEHLEMLMRSQAAAMVMAPRESRACEHAES